MNSNFIKATILVAFFVISIPLIYLGWKNSTAKIDFKALDNAKSNEMNVQTDEQFNQFLKNIGSSSKEVSPDILKSTDTSRLAMSIELLDTLEQYAYAGVLAEKLATIQKSDYRYAQSAHFFLSETANHPSPQNDFMFLKKAKQNLEKSLEINPSNNNVKVELALSILNIQDIQPPKGSEQMKPMLMLLDVVKNDSNNIEANYYLAKLGVRSGQFEKAIERFKKLVSLQPQNQEYFELSQIYKLWETKEESNYGLKKAQSLNKTIK
jgi:tetratricopeptide (TPR) repeat protein